MAVDERRATGGRQIEGPWTHREVTVNGVRLHYVEAGTGPLIILLHGFPEFWYSWRNQIPVLAAAGYRVIAPDMRGYNTSAKPPGVQHYTIELLTGDVAGLMRHAGAENAVIVGHDWGGAVAWQMPLRHPTLVSRLVVLNAPHPAAYLRALRTPEQILKSWYVLFFQTPLLPEAAFRAFGFAALERVLRTDPIRPGAFSDAEIHEYKRALARPGALTAAINYYRAAARRNPFSLAREMQRIDHPTLLIWGEQDRALTVQLTEDLEQWVPAIRIERIADASHWVQNDAPERVNELLLSFLASSANPPASARSG